MEWIATVAGVAAVYFAAKFFATNVSMLAYIYWMEEEKHTQPTRDQLDVYRKKVIREMFK